MPADEPLTESKWNDFFHQSVFLAKSLPTDVPDIPALAKVYMSVLAACFSLKGISVRSSDVSSQLDTVLGKTEKMLRYDLDEYEAAEEYCIDKKWVKKNISAMERRDWERASRRERHPDSIEEASDYRLKILPLGWDIYNALEKPILPSPPTAENDVVREGKHASWTGRDVKFEINDAWGRRVLVMPGSELAWIGNPTGSILDIEASTNTRLKNGQNPNFFIRLHEHYKNRPVKSVPFADFCKRRHPDLVDIVSIEDLQRPNAEQSAKSELVAPVFTHTQNKILAKLDGNGWTAEDLAKMLALGVTTVKKALAILKKAGAVANKPGLGYYRPDKPPRTDAEA